MVAPILMAIPFVANFALEKFREVLEITQLISDRFADFGFSLFICLGGDNDELFEWLLEGYKTFLLVYTYVCTPELMMLKYYDEINRDEELKAWFTQSSYLKSTMEAITQAKQDKIEVDNLEDLLRAVYEYSPFSFVLAVLDQFILEPFALTNEIAHHIKNILTEEGYLQVAKVKDYIKRFDQQSRTQIAIPKSMELVDQINPFLPFWFCQLSAHVKAYLTYKRIYEIKDKVNAPKQLLKELYGKFYFNEELREQTKPTEDLNFIFKLPTIEILQASQRKVKIDYAGLISETEIKAFCRETFELLTPDMLKTVCCECFDVEPPDMNVRHFNDSFEVFDVYICWKEWNEEKGEWELTCLCDPLCPWQSVPLEQDPRAIYLTSDSKEGAWSLRLSGWAIGYGTVKIRYTYNAFDQFRVTGWFKQSANAVGRVGWIQHDSYEGRVQIYGSTYWTGNSGWKWIDITFFYDEDRDKKWGRRIIKDAPDGNVESDQIFLLGEGRPSAGNIYILTTGGELWIDDLTIYEL